MKITGEMLIGSRAVRGTEGEVSAVNPATGEQIEPAFGGGDRTNVDEACSLAARAFDSYRSTSLETRATFLEAIAQGLLDAGDDLVDRVTSETALPRTRVEAERGRTVGQLRLFAEVVRDGELDRCRAGFRAAGTATHCAARSQKEKNSSRSGGRLWREQFSARIFGCGRRHRLRVRGRLPCGGEVSPFSPGYLRACWPDHSKSGVELQIA